MNTMKKSLVAVLMAAVLVAPMGIVGCSRNDSATQKARQEELAREAEYRQQLRDEELQQAQQETRKKQSEADGQDLENVGTAVGIGGSILYILYLVFGSGE